MHSPTEEHYHKMRHTIEEVSSITSEDWELCREGLRYRQIPKGGFFAEEGQTCPYIGFVLQGLLRTYYLVDGEEINSNFYFECQWPKAYHNFLTQTSGRMWIKAVEDTELLLLSYDHLHHLFRQSRNWERFGRISAENAYVAAQLRNEMLLLDKPAERYLKLTREHPELLERVPLSQLASYIGIKQPSLSRIRRRLAQKNKT